MTDWARSPLSLREPSGKPSGGQLGHLGKTLKRVSHADHVIEHQLPQRCACGAALDEARARLSERRQVFDIPVARYQVTEHRTRQLRCTCGVVHQSAFPESVSEVVQYGPNVRALAVHLTHGQLLPLARAAQLISQIFALNLSQASVLVWIDQASRRLRPAVEHIAQALVTVPVAHADESGLRVDARLHWLHTVASETLTWYGVHAKRGMPAIEAHGILRRRIAALVHDCWAPYWDLRCVHALCNAHLLRELTFVHESTGQGWAKRMMGLLRRANQRCETARLAGKTAITAITARQIRGIVKNYQLILAQADADNPQATRQNKRRGRVKQSVAFILISRMREHAEAVLRFVTDLRVPFTNNLGECAIRMPKVKQKISGCFRTFKGAQVFCTIRSYLDTMLKQGRNLFEVLRSVSQRNTMPTASQTLAQFASGLTFEQIPPEAVERAKDCLIDTVGACVLGAQMPWTRTVIDYAKRNSAEGESNVMGTSIKLRAPFACLANGAASHAFELDALCEPSVGMHPGAALAVPGLAIAQSRKLSGKELVTAFVAGFEVLYRIGQATRLTPEKLGFHAPGVMGVYGAACVSAKRFNENAEQMANAFGIAGSMSSGLMEFSKSGGLVKRLHLRRAAEGGFMAAALAREGYTGPAEVLEGQYGSLNTFCRDPPPELMTQDLGQVWHTMKAKFKRFACHSNAQVPVTLNFAL